MTPRLGQPDFPLAGLQLLYGGDNVVTKLEVGDKAFIIESNRIVREVIVLKRSRDFFTVRFVENTSGLFDIIRALLLFHCAVHRMLRDSRSFYQDSLC